MAVLHFDKNELGNLEYSLQRRDAQYEPGRRVHEYDDRLLQYAQVPRTDGLPEGRPGREQLRPSVVGRRNRRPARAVVQSGDSPVSRSLRSPGAQIHHRFHLHARAGHHLPGRRRNSQEGAAVDPLADATADPLHAARRPLADPAPAPAVSGVPRPAYGRPRQHGGRRPELSDRGRSPQPALRRLSVGCTCRSTRPASSSRRRTGTTTSSTARRSPGAIRATRTCSRPAISSSTSPRGRASSSRARPSRSIRRRSTRSSRKSSRDAPIKSTFCRACATRPASSSSATATGPRSWPATRGSGAGAATRSSRCPASR